MSYKEKYEKALERARKLHSEPTGGTERIVCEQIFPELIESEDEKIRKNLITFLKDEYGTNSNARFAGVKVRDIIAWLEKQGLQNLANPAKTCKDEEDWSEEDELLHNQKE